MSLHTVINYGNYKVHWAKARREDLAKALPPEELTVENWWHWQTLCGKELIGRVTEDYPVDCKACAKSYEKGQRQAAALIERFGGA